MYQTDNFMARLRLFKVEGGQVLVQQSIGDLTVFFPISFLQTNNLQLILSKWLLFLKWNKAPLIRFIERATNTPRTFQQNNIPRTKNQSGVGINTRFWVKKIQYLNQRI